MNEEEVIAELSKLNSAFPEGNKTVLHGAKTVYLAGGWWGEYQPSLLIRAYQALLENHTISHIHVPVMHQYQGDVATENHEPSMEWAQMTFKADMVALNNSDLYVGLYPVEDQDTGTAMELGYAYGKKPIVNVYEGDWNEQPVNLMLSMGADAYVRKAEALKDFNFLDISPNVFGGKII